MHWLAKWLQPTKEAAAFLRLGCLQDRANGKPPGKDSQKR
jgi:hypothetical protein